MNNLFESNEAYEGIEYTKLFASNLSFLETLGIDIKQEYSALSALLEKRGLNVKDAEILPGLETVLTDTERLSRTAVARPVSSLVAESDMLVGMVWNAVSMSKYATYDNVNYLTGDIKAPINSISQAPKSLVTGFPELSRTLVNQETAKEVTIYDGKFLTLKLLFSPTGYLRLGNSEEGVSYLGFFGLKLPLDHPEFKKMLQSLGCKNNRSKNWVGSQILKSIWTGQTVPSFFLTGGVDDSVALKGGVYKLTSGRYIMIPERKVYSNDLHTLQDFFSTGNRTMEKEGFDLPPNRIFFVNKKSKIMTCSDEKGDLLSINLPGITPVSDVDRKMIMSKPLTFLISKSGSGLNADLTWSMVGGTKGIYDKIHSLMVEKDKLYIFDHIDSEVFKEEILTPLYKVGMGRYGSSTRIINFITFMGSVSLLLSCAGKRRSIDASVALKRKTFEETDASSLPAIPCIRDDLVMFPHQAASVAKLNVANDLAIIDVGTGGGKTITLILDAINMMNQGTISRPLIIMPKSLISTWVSQISYFTNNQMNIIVVDSKMKNKIKKSKDVSSLEEICNAAPPNTIFITSYSYVILNNKKLGKDFEGNDIFSFENAQWLIDYVQPDYVALDESHYIKNVTSKYNMAVNYLGSNTAVRRIATGTLITNNPLDLVGQLQFLDPCIVGNKNEFYSRYAKEGDPKKGWQDNFAEDLRNHLGDYTSYIMYREKDWAPLLPTLNYSYHLVDMTDNQISFYKKLTLDILEEIQDDPQLASAWARMQEADEDFEGISPMLLGKLAQLEQYLTAPNTKELMTHSSDEKDAISCKLDKIDELIDKSLASKEINNKVIVATHYKESAMHLYQNSKHKKVSVYYDASKKENLEAFKTDPSVKVVFCVIQSITEGHNLQMANRIIIADVDWTPGKLKQLEARIYRPHVKIKGDKIENLNADKVVYIDTVLANDSADCIKFSFQMHKKILNAKIMENCPLTENPKVGFSGDILTARFEDPPIFGGRLIELNDSYNSWMQNLIAEEKQKGDLNFVKPSIVPDGGNIEIGYLESMPWIPGVTLDLKDGEEPLMTYLENQGYKHGESFVNYKDALGNQYVRCEKGVGYITGVSAKRVRIKTNQGNISLDPAVVIRIADKNQVAKISQEEAEKRLIGKKVRTKGMSAAEVKEHRAAVRELFLEFGLKLRKKRNIKTGKTQFAIASGTTIIEPDEIFLDLVREGSDLPVTSLRHVSLAQWEEIINKVLKENSADNEVEEDEEVTLEIHPGSYNDIPCLVAYPDSGEEDEILLDYGFTKMGGYWDFKVPNTRVGLEMLAKLNKAYTIPKKIYEECEEFINDLKRSKYPYYYPEEGVRNFIRDNKKASAQGALRIYPLVVNDSLHLVVDIKTNKGISLSKFKFTKEEGSYIYLSTKLSDLKRKWKEINKDFEVTNRTKAIKLADKLFDITLT